MITLKIKYKKDSHHSLNIDKIFIVRNARRVVAYKIIRYAFNKNFERKNDVYEMLRA
jgi:pyridoxine 5'-phosphate synthase PdxJ